jgi:uncharacterized coiled-coil protein SlyX
MKMSEQEIDQTINRLQQRVDFLELQKRVDSLHEQFGLLVKIVKANEEIAINDHNRKCRRAHTRPY